MKFAKFLALSVLPVVAIASSPSDAAYKFEHHANLYNLDVNDDALRETFEANMKVIATSNDYYPSKFTHWTPEEFKRMANGYRPRSTRTRQTATAGSSNRLRGLQQSLPSSIDWVEQGAVSPVKDQGTCGSCYIFAATAALEAAYFFANDTLLSFSEEQTLECANIGGCGGGLSDSVYTYVNSTGGLETYADLPYTYQNYVQGEIIEACPSSLPNLVPMTISEVVQVPANSTQALMEAVAQSPVVVWISGAGCPGFQSNFGNGTSIFTQAQCSCDSQTESDGHMVTVVGYGTQDGTDYWKIKNSWGTSWGNDGYFLLARDSNQTSGECNVLSNPEYPILA